MATQNGHRQLTIEWHDPSPNLPRAASMSGIEYMQAILRGEMIRPPISILLDFELTAVEEGYAVFTGHPGEQHYNPIGSVHGGYAATLLDSAMGCAIHTILPQGKAYATAQLNINLTRPIMPGTGILLCEGRVIHSGSRMATAEGTLKDENGKLYAHGTTTCFVFSLQDMQ